MMRSVRWLWLCVFVAVTARAFAADEPVDMTIVALGDSITAGNPGFRSPSEFPPDGSGNESSQYEYWIMQRHPEWRVLNRGIGGQRSDEILRRFNSDVLAVKPDVVILLAGINDLYQGRPPEHVITHLRQLAQQATDARVRVMLCTVLPFDGMSDHVAKGIATVNDWIRDYTESHHLGYCDTFHAMEDPEQRGTLISTDDGMHPDVDGYRRMGEAIAGCLERWLGLAAVEG